MRNLLSTTLTVVIGQNLFRRIDQKGRCAVLETMVCTNAISNLIREGKTGQIVSATQTDKKLGPHRLDDAILDLLNKKWISHEEAYEKSHEKSTFASFMTTPPDQLA